MAIRKEDWPLIKLAIDEAVAPLHPHGWKKALFLLREWSVLATTVTVIVALLGLAASQFYYANQRIKEEAKFEATANDRLTVIESGLKSISSDITKQALISHSGLPLDDFRISLPALSSALASARRQNSSVPIAIVEELKRKLIATNNDSPGYWPAAAELVSYTSLNANPNPSGLTDSNLPNCTDGAPHPAQVLAADPQKFTFRGEYYENCRFTLDSDQDDARVNSLLSNETLSLTFKHCLVVYRGGKIRLIIEVRNKTGTVESVDGKKRSAPFTFSGETVFFSDCMFDFRFNDQPASQGKQFTQRLLASDGSDISLPDVHS